MNDSSGEDAKDWSYTSHVRADLRGVDLSGADLRRAIFDGADLEGADLSGADLRGASFKRANLMKKLLLTIRTCVTQDSSKQN